MSRPKPGLFMRTRGEERERRADKGARWFGDEGVVALGQSRTERNAVDERLSRCRSRVLMNSPGSTSYSLSPFHFHELHTTAGVRPHVCLR